jgi:hypothetical protein
VLWLPAVVLILVGLDQVIRPEPLMAGLALGQRVDELGDVTAGLPYLRREYHAGVQADDVVALGDDRLPPLPLDVVLDLHAERAVVPGRPQTAVDLAGRVDDPPTLAEADYGIQAVVATSHRILQRLAAVNGLIDTLNPGGGGGHASLAVFWCCTGCRYRGR